MQISIKNFRFRKKDVKRTVNEIIHFVVYLGLGKEYHCCSADKLFNVLKNKDKYDKITRGQFNTLLTQVNGRRGEFDFWRVDFDKENDLVKVR